jgi:capsule polysaccharide modification protein KpsS
VIEAHIPYNRGIHIIVCSFFILPCELFDKLTWLLCRQEYDEFVKEFVKHLVLQFRERAETYVTLAIQASLKIYVHVIQELLARKSTIIARFQVLRMWNTN